MIAGTATRPVGRRAHAEVLRPALRASGTGLARRKTRPTRPSPAPFAAGAPVGPGPGASVGLAAPSLSPSILELWLPFCGFAPVSFQPQLQDRGELLSSGAGAAPELPSGPSWCGVGGRSSGCSAGPLVPSATRTRLPKDR